MNRVEDKEKIVPTMQSTSCFLVDSDGKVLLGMKRRGFATGKWNGYGGKRDKSETVEQAARREVFEESGITLTSLTQVAVLNCHHPSFGQQVTVYTATEWKGEAVETEEMSPQWFSQEAIPYSNMWSDSSVWLPLILEGKKLNAEFYFDGEGELVNQEIVLVNNFD
jgi:8-oxo-dGTP diphosphatase / 2-hydroxy-dATP diphosphatase